MSSEAAQWRLMKVVKEYAGDNLTEGEMLSIAERIWTDHEEEWTLITEDELISYMS